MQKKTLTPKNRDLNPFSRQISLPYSYNRKRHFSKSADTALFSGYKNAPLFCIKIRVQMCQRTLILIQFELRFLLHFTFSFGHSRYLSFKNYNSVFLLNISIYPRLSNLDLVNLDLIVSYRRLRKK